MDVLNKPENVSRCNVLMIEAFRVAHNFEGPVRLEHVQPPGSYYAATAQALRRLVRKITRPRNPSLISPQEIALHEVHRDIYGRAYRTGLNTHSLTWDPLPPRIKEAIQHLLDGDTNYVVPEALKEHIWDDAHIHNRQGTLAERITIGQQHAQIHQVAILNYYLQNP